MYAIEQRELVEQTTAVIRGKVAVAELPEWFGHVYEVTARVIGEAGADVAGPPFSRFRRVDEAVFEVEAGFPVTSPIEAAGEVEPSSLPGGRAIATWHVGPYDAMAPAYEALDAWLADHRATATGPPWENYVSEPVGDPATWRTQIVQPYRASADHTGE